MLLRAAEPQDAMAFAGVQVRTKPTRGTIIRV
jgi:hypothetical protein